MSATTPPSTAPAPALIQGPSAWLAADMRQREPEWRTHLTPPQIAEIETAVQATRAPRHLPAIRREDFPLPTLGPVLDKMRADVLDGRGFAVLRGMPVTNRPIAEIAAAYWGIGTYFGTARSQNARGHLLGHALAHSAWATARPTRICAATPTAERQNFHIDRCDVVALLVPAPREIRRVVGDRQLR